MGILDDWGRPPILVENNNNGQQVLDVLCHTHNYESVVSYHFEGFSKQMFHREEVITFMKYATDGSVKQVGNKLIVKFDISSELSTQRQQKKLEERLETKNKF